MLISRTNETALRKIHVYSWTFTEAIPLSGIEPANSQLKAKFPNHCTALPQYQNAQILSDFECFFFCLF